MAIVLLVITGHRRKSAFLAAGCLLFMLATLVQFAAKLSELQSEAATRQSRQVPSVAS
jgi:hypothetical protein